MLFLSERARPGDVAKENKRQLHLLPRVADLQKFPCLGAQLFWRWLGLLQQGIASKARSPLKILHFRYPNTTQAPRTTLSLKERGAISKP